MNCFAARRLLFRKANVRNYSHQHRPSNQDACLTCCNRRTLEKKVKIQTDLNQRLQEKKVSQATRAAIGFSLLYLLVKVFGE